MRTFAGIVIVFLCISFYGAPLPWPIDGAPLISFKLLLISGIFYGTRLILFDKNTGTDQQADPVSEVVVKTAETRTYVRNQQARRRSTFEQSA